MKRYTLVLFAAAMVFCAGEALARGPSYSGGGSGSGDMAKSVYDTDGNSKVDAGAVDDLSATYQPKDADLTTWAGVTPASGATPFLSGVTPPYVNTLTSDAQAQINGKQAADADLTTWAGVTPASGATEFLSGVTPVYVNSLTSSAQAQFDALPSTYAPISITGDINSVLDDTSGAVPMLIQADTAFPSGATNPSVAGHSFFITANVGATTINDFTSPTAGQLIYVTAGDALTTLDFTASNLVGTTADYLMVEGETAQFHYGADTKWHFLGSPKTFATVTIGGGTANSLAYWNNSGNLASGVTPVKEWVWSPVSGVTNADDTYWKAVESGITIHQIDVACYHATTSGCSETVRFWECDSAMANCSAMHNSLTAEATFTNTSATATTTTMTNATIDRGDYVFIDVSSGTSVAGMTITIQYSVGP